ncbi:hypothetical protein ACHHYP_10384 [Achlya hypogyna]|uniref:Uncharacterized protein n=1 Tax=Achlya hypogyna TaxID=1202772 RepID=A0A1V9YLK6_ACHHY|nr:hypothetical protein ACHHYP_10384 [Achlya hypogyna]
MASGRAKLTLERVLGLTATSNAGVSVSSATGDIAYPAGCVVVIYNFRRDKQVRYYRVEKPVAAVAFSPDGRLLGIAEKGHAPAITVWDTSSGQLRAELKGHKYGIAALAMSTDGRFLVSAGLVHDNMLYAWDISSQSLLGAAAIGVKIYGLDYNADGRCFVTVGDAHFWSHDGAQFATTGQTLLDGVPELRSTPAVLSRLADAAFVGVGCGAGNKTYCVTLCGYLCCFGGATMERLVSLEASRGFALSVTPAYVAVGGSSAIVRLFDPATLEYKQTLPFPAHTADAPLPDALLMPPVPAQMPAVLGLRVAGAHAIVVYADHAMRIVEIPTRLETRSFLFHPSGVNGVAPLGAVVGVDTRQRVQWAPPTTPSFPVPDGAFATVADDGTLRLWHLEYAKKHQAPQPWCQPHSSDLLAIVIVGDSPRCPHDELPDAHVPRDADAGTGLLCLATDGAAKIAVGDSRGGIHVVELRWPLRRPTLLPAPHASAVSAVAFAAAGTLASGGRDRMLHVYAPSGELRKRLENHSGAVHTVRFSQDGKRLVSAGADHVVAFTQVSDDRIFLYNSMPVVGGRLHDVAVVGNDALLVAVHARVDVHTLVSNKLVASHALGEHNHVAAAPGPSLLGLSGAAADKCVYVVDYATGDVLTKAAGHGDVVTGVTFTLDGRRLVSTSADGCIFVWRLSEDLQLKYKAMLPAVVPGATTVDVPPPMPPVAPPLLPPPAPPVLAPPPAPRAPAPPPVATAPPVFTVATEASGLALPLKSWQDGKQVVPGPMAPLPMEEWMKTKPTFELTPPKALEGLPKDRVPEWARTMKLAVKDDAAPRTSKWGADVIDSIAAQSLSSSDSDADDSDDADSGSQTLYIKQSSGALHAVEVPVDVKAALLVAPSTTLDHAREQLAKRKQQQDTANAVAEMQSKLGQLGILKRKPEDEADSFAAGYHAEMHGILRRDDADVGASCVVLQSLDLFTTGYRPVVGTAAGQAFSPLAQSVDTLPTDRSLTNFVAGYNGATAGVTDSLDVTAMSLSQFTAGHSERALILSPRRCTAIGTVGSVDALTTGVSLSRFLTGDAHVTDSIDAVTASLSTFVAGHAPPPTVSPRPTAAKTAPPLAASASLELGAVSWSQFTAGFADVNQSVELPAASLSQFTTGFRRSLAESQSLDLGNVSLSQYIGGSTIAPEAKASVDLSNTSLSVFVAGHHRQGSNAPSPQAPRSRPASVASSNSTTEIAEMARLLQLKIAAFATRKELAAAGNR